MDKSDFAIYQKGGDVLSMGFKFENLLKDKGLPAMIGGGKGKFHKNQYGIIFYTLILKEFTKEPEVIINICDHTVKWNYPTLQLGMLIIHIKIFLWRT